MDLKEKSDPLFNTFKLNNVFFLLIAAIYFLNVGWCHMYDSKFISD